MKVSGFRFAVLVFSVFSLCILYILSSVPDRVQAATTLTPRPLAAPLTRPLARYATAAQTLREGDLQAARQLLEQVARRYPDEAVRARLLAGFYAWEAGEDQLAEELLGQVSVPGGELEDWRLFLLAESARENGDGEVAIAALDRLIADCPDSPLRARAFLEAAELYLEQGDERRTLELIDGARREEIGGEEEIELDNLAWKIGQRLDDEEIRREAARRLLVAAPLKAGALGVASTFRAVDGSIDWNRVLSSGEVKRRARSFLTVERLTAALDTLENVPETERDTEWHLLKARVLTESSRVSDALSVLDAVAPRDEAEEAELEWERTLATARAGRAGVERRAMLEASHRHLSNVIRLGADERLSTPELRDLYEDFLEAGLFDQAMDTLRILRRIDARDTTGARELWEKGWEAYGRNNLDRAVTYWTQLADIYPGQGDAQRGLYWTARAYERLGSPGRAQALYRDLTASSDTTDFYRRQAMERLGVPPVSSSIALARAAAPWPADPALQRAKRLSDLGLDKLAGREMDLVEKGADPRDLLALKALVMGRQGKRREGIALLRQAFPALGGPRQSTVPEEVLLAYYPLEYGDAIRAQARANGLSPALIAGIIRQESAFDPRATSPVGARGLMQIMPATAQEMSQRLDRPFPAKGLYDPEYSIELGSAYVRQLLKMFDGNVELALAGYNGGPNRIRRMWEEAGPGAQLDDFVENMDLDESRDYVKRILVLADSYRQLYPSTS